MFQLIKLIKRLKYPLVIALVFLLLPTISFAQDYQTIYNAQYFPDLQGNSNVKFNITITNLRSDVYVKEFSLSFPQSFAIENIVASDDWGEIPTEIEKGERSFKIKLSFSSPTTGKNSQNNFYLDFLQKNLFKVSGNIWEVILPTISNKDNSVFNVTVHLPDGEKRKISIAKPKPTSIQGNTISWQDVKTRTIYAVFGNSQFYELRLTYNLKNDKIVRVYYDIAFPPETLYQKVFVTSIDPKPEKVFLDSDGNYLGRYTLSSKENKQVVFNGFVEVFPQSQGELKTYINNAFKNQRNYLLTNQEFWDLGEYLNDREIKQIKTASDIYNFVSNKLSYNYKRVSKNIKRMGAENILKQPNLAVCMEFTDLFIALAREKGIFAREINGYGFSEDQNLRPLSLISDVLHSWPEYFDERAKIWIPVDPTWENTSGIDYFNSFDLNHIVLAIHGKNSSYPLAAGLYKTEDSKDISIKPINTLPKETIDIQIKDDIRANIISQDTHKGKITIENTGNIFIKNIPLEIKSSALVIKPNKIVINLLAPQEKRDWQIEYASKQKNTDQQDIIQFIFNGNILSTKPIKIVSFYRDLLYKVLGGFIGFSFVLVVYLFFLKKR